MPPKTGNLVICGRAKDVIIMAGRNIYPADIERAAARVDGVRPGGAVAIASMPDTPARNVRRRRRIQ